MSEPSPKYMFGSDQRVAIHDCVPMAPLVRLARNETEYQALLNDMAKRGQKVPVKSRPHPDPVLRSQGKLEILDGMGRLAVALELGWDELRADIEDLSDQEAYEIAFTLNINRENLNALSIASWLWYMRKQFGYTQEKLGEISGRGQSWVSRHLAMIEQPKEQTSFDYSEPQPQPSSERQARALRSAPDDIRQQVMSEAIADGEIPSARDIERRSNADYTPEQVLARYAGRQVDDEFLVYLLQEDAGLTVAEAKQRVTEFRVVKRTSSGPKANPNAPNVWTKLSQYYPTEIIDEVSKLTPSENLDTLIKYCRRYSQKLYLKAPELLRQAVLEEWQ